LSKREHQLKLLKAQLKVGTDCLFASPNCAPWGNDSRAVTAQKREERRGKETNTLAFLAVACIFQFLLDRKYIVENSAYSDIFAKSPLEILRQLPFYLALFDQCSCGPSLNGEYVRKRSHFQSSHVFHHLQKLCPGGHEHLHLRGGGLAASAALYPDPECKLILSETQLPADACKGGRNLLANGTSVSDFVRMSWEEQLRCLRSIAQAKGISKVWSQVVQPWLKDKGDVALQTFADIAPHPDCLPWQHKIPPIVAAGTVGKSAEEDTMFDFQAEDPAHPEPPFIDQAPSKTKLADLVTAFDKDKSPWQYQKYSAENSLWQGAAQRRRAHPRRTNTSLGVCSCDLGGPYGPTPRPGNLTHRNPCY
jgi:hypothetical protein